MSKWFEEQNVVLLGSRCFDGRARVLAAVMDLKLTKHANSWKVVVSINGLNSHHSLDLLIDRACKM